MTTDDPTISNEHEGQAVVERAAHAWDTTKAKADEALQTSERYVQDHPGTSILGVFSVGLLLGVFIGWKAAHEERDDVATSAHNFLKRWGHKLNLD